MLTPLWVWEMVYKVSMEPDLQKCLGSKAVLSPNSKGTKKSYHREKKAAISIQTTSNRAQQQHLEILFTLRLWSSSGVNELRCIFKILPVKYIIRGHYSNESIISHLNLLSTGQSYNTVIPKKNKNKKTPWKTGKHRFFYQHWDDRGGKHERI